MGNGCRIQGGAYIADRCILGEFVFIGPNATLLNDKYPPSGDSKLWRPVEIGNNAVIGGGATVVAGCIIGNMAVLGAGSVLTKDIPDGEVWAGNPAKFMMSREQYNSKRENLKQM
jgi:acetyltransferase-like isoleucine patch superfamily enzyme